MSAAHAGTAQVHPFEGSASSEAPEPRARHLSRREQIWVLVEDSTIIGGFIFLVIVFSTVSFVLETEPALKGEDMQGMWFGFETFAVVIFSIEYGVRLFCCPNRRAFVMAPLNIVDLLAILPYYITLGVAASIGVSPWDRAGMAGSATAVRTTTVFRAVRLFRVLRIFKLGRYSAGMQVFYGALAHSATSLSLLGFLMAITIILFSSVMYIVEGQGDKTDEYCAENAPYACEFRTIPTTFWWAIVTMTTVGYGDAVPFTTAGKLIASATMICGIIVIALPISVLGNNFTKLMQQYNDESIIITQADIDGSGFVDAAEVGRWLQAMRKAGKIRDERLTAEELIKRYDKGGKVGLERREFLRMCRETVHQGGPSNRELLQKLSRLGTQLEIIDERLRVLEKHSFPGGGSGKDLGGGHGGGGSCGGGAGGDTSSTRSQGQNGGDVTLVQEMDSPHLEEGGGPNS